MPTDPKSLPLVVAGTSASGSAGAHGAVRLLRALPPEAIVQVVAIVHDIVRTNGVLAARRQEFEHGFAVLREENADRQHTIAALSNLLAGGVLSEEAQLRLVDAVCAVAMK